jgi:type II secretory pathway pseudopilin PulG
LLVVIAIIAILAAILFPVFAQAKAAAKKTASISNNKQISLGAIMYSGDQDDVITSASTQSGTAASSGGSLYFGAFWNNPWPSLINPYVKNFDLFADPQAAPGKPTTLGYPRSTGNAAVPHYGINPYIVQQVSYPFPTTYPTYTATSGLVPRSYTSIARPADTVFAVAKYSSAETTGSWYGDYWFGQGTHWIDVTVDPPDCASPGNGFVCAAGWGNNGFYGGTGGTKYLNNVEAAGAWTGGGSLRGTRRMIVSYTDGHVASKSPEAMAEGTNYNPTKGANGIPTQSDTQIVITPSTGLAVEKWYGLQ